jgi:acetyl esterase/lipase
MKNWILLLCLSLAAGADSWTPPDGKKQLPIWPPKSPILAKGIRKLEDPHILARKPITNVSVPTYTVFSPQQNASGTCVLIFPGGGHLSLAMGIEGVEVARWLAKHGITAVLVKYRVPYSGCYWDRKKGCNVTPEVPMALQDAQRTLSVIRSRSKELKIAADRIGVMGFSAGGNVAVLASTRFPQRTYPVSDSIDQISCRPDFAIPVFAGHMLMTHKNVPSQALNTDITIGKDMPPTLLIHAKDDPVNPVHYSMIYAKALQKAGQPVTLKLYETGGHAFGVNRQGTDSDRWPEEALAWLKKVKML